MHSNFLRYISRFGGVMALSLAGAAFPSALAAQQATPPPSQEQEIIVTGVRNQLEAIEDYVGGLTVVTGKDPLSRYQPDVYCPAVIGLSEARNAQIAARMRNVAAAADVKPAKEGCRPSALVIFVDDKRSFLEAFRKQHPIYFSDLRGEGWSPPDEKGPALAWHLVQHLDPQGNPVQKDPELGYAIVESSVRGSNVLSMIRPVVAMSVVLVERKALQGLTVEQIADYVLMRTLTDRKPKDHDLRDLTILGALEAPVGSAVPASLTDFDLAYLKGRYSGDPSRYGRSQRSAISRSIKRAVKAKDEK
jgi:hypothetical protein